MNLMVFQNPHSRRGNTQHYTYSLCLPCGPGIGLHIWEDKRSQVGITHLTKEKTATLRVNSSPRSPDNNFCVGLALTRHFFQCFCFWQQGVEITLFSALSYSMLRRFQDMTCPWQLSFHKDHWAPFWILKQKQGVLQLFVHKDTMSVQHRPWGTDW